MAYDRYPAIDENDNFPPVVREALAQSDELRSMVVPMSTAARELLLASDKWDGRVILNTSRDRLERWDGTAWFDVASDLLTDNPRLIATPSDVAGDYNTKTLSGWYGMGGASTNGPGGGLAYHLEVRAFGTTYIEQIARAVVSGVTHRRRMVAGTWRAWIPDGWFTWSASIPNLNQTTTYAKIRRDGDTVFGRWTGTATAGVVIGPILIDFPTVNGVTWGPAADTRFNEDVIWGKCQFLRSGVAWYDGIIKPIIYASVKRMGFYEPDGSGAHWTVNTPATCAVGDRFGVDFMYEAEPLT